MIDLPIDTERLTIRHLAPMDIGRYMEFMLDEESTQYLAFDPVHKTKDGAETLFHFIVESYSSKEPVHAFAIEDRQSGDYVGSCGFAPYDDGVLECYYCVDRGHRGRGIAVEATRALLTALAPIAEVRAFCHSDNVAAHSVAQRCGMTPRGRERNKNTGLEGYAFVRARS